MIVIQYEPWYPLKKSQRFEDNLEKMDICGHFWGKIMVGGHFWGFFAVKWIFFQEFF